MHSSLGWFGLGARGGKFKCIPLSDVALRAAAALLKTNSS